MSDALTRRSFLMASGLLVAGAGCRLQRQALPQRTFALAVPRANSVPNEGKAGVLLVRPFRVSPMFESRTFVIRRGEAEYTPDAYHAFLLSPGPMLTETMADWIRGLGVFGTVTTGGSQVVATHAIEGEVVELYGDYRDSGRLTANLAIRLRLLQPLTGVPRVRWQREERHAIPMARAGAEELVAGWNRALAEICRALTPALFQQPG